MAVKDIIFEAQVKFDRQKSNLDTLQKELDEVTKDLKQAKDGSEEFRKAQFKLAEVNKQLSNTLDVQGAKTDNLSGKMQLAGKVFTGVFAAKLLKDFATAGFESATALEANSIAFETMLGNADQAKELLKEIQQFTASTPFQEEEVTSAGKALLAFNIEANKIVPTLKRIGDISAGIGAPIGEIAEIYGKARVQGRLFAEDINQLTGRGIPIIQELAKQFNITDGEVKKLVEDGKVGFPQLEEAFVSLTSEGGKFAGLTEKLSTSTKGALSTLKDNFKALAREAILPLLPAITKVFQNVTKNIKEIGKSLGVFREEEKKTALETVELVKENNAFIDSGKKLIERYEELTDKTSKTTEEKEELKNVTNDLIDKFGDSVISIDKETGALKVNTQEVIRQIQVKSALQSETVKELLAEKLRLEQLALLAKQARDQLDELQENISDPQTTAFEEYGADIDNYIELLKKAQGEENALSLAFGGALFKDTQTILSSLPKDVQNVITHINKLYQTSNNGAATLARGIEADLKKLGIDLDEIASNFQGETTDNLNKTLGGFAAGSIAELQKFLNDAEKELLEKTDVDNEKQVKERLANIEKAKVALEKAKEQVFGIDDKTLDNLSEQERVAVKNAQLEEKSQSEILSIKISFAEKRKEFFEQQGETDTAQYKKLTNDLVLLKKEREGKLVEEGFTDRTSQLAEEERHQKAIEEIQEISEVKKLETAIFFEEARLAIIRKRFSEESLEYQKQFNLIEELNQKLTAAEKKENEKRKENTVDSIEEVADAFVGAFNKVLDAETANVDASISAQERRVEAAADIAEKGNAEALEREEERLAKLHEKHEKYVKLQQALALAQAIANGIVAVTKAAAEGGGFFSAATIAAVLGAIAAGVVAATSITKSSFYEGGLADWSKETGYTGDGNPSTVSRVLGMKPYDYEKQEYIMPHGVTKKGNNLKWFERIRRESLDLDAVFSRARNVHNMEIQMKAGGDFSGLENRLESMSKDIKDLSHAVRNQKPYQTNITKDGVIRIYEDAEFKRKRIEKRSGR